LGDLAGDFVGEFPESRFGDLAGVASSEGTGERARRARVRRTVGAALLRELLLVRPTSTFGGDLGCWDDALVERLSVTPPPGSLWTEPVSLSSEMQPATEWRLRVVRRGTGDAGRTAAPPPPTAAPPTADIRRTCDLVTRLGESKIDARCILANEAEINKTLLIIDKAILSRPSGGVHKRRSQFLVLI